MLSGNWPKEAECKRCLVSKKLIGLFIVLSAAPPAAPANPAQGAYGPPVAQQPLAYQPQPQAPPATFMQPPMAPMPAAMPLAIPPGMPPMGAFQNDELGNEAGSLPGLTGNHGMETGLSDASLMNAFQNENQWSGLLNDKLPPSEQSNFVPPPLTDEQQQPLADVPASEPPAANPMIAPQPGWERSSTVQ